MLQFDDIFLKEFHSLVASYYCYLMNDFLNFVSTKTHQFIYFIFLGHRTEQDLFVRLVDSVTRQVSTFIFFITLYISLSS